MSKLVVLTVSVNHFGHITVSWSQMLVLRCFITEKLWYIARDALIYSKTCCLGMGGNWRYHLVLFGGRGVGCGILFYFSNSKITATLSMEWQGFFFVVWGNCPSSYIQGKCLRNQTQNTYMQNMVSVIDALIKLCLGYGCLGSMNMVFFPWSKRVLYSVLDRLWKPTITILCLVFLVIALFWDTK